MFFLFIFLHLLIYYSTNSLTGLVTYFNFPPSVCRITLLSGLRNFFAITKNIYFCIFLCRCERNSLPGLLNMFTHFRFQIWILLLFYWTKKKFSCIMWASHFVLIGNKLYVCSWLTTEVQVCRNVGRPNPRPPNLVFKTIFRRKKKLYSPAKNENQKYVFFLAWQFFRFVSFRFFCKICFEFWRGWNESCW